MIDLFNQIVAYFSQSMFHVIMFGIVVMALSSGLDDNNKAK